MEFDCLKLNNRVGILDEAKGKWREARIIEIMRDREGKVNEIKIHYKGLHSKFDEIITRN
jgi:hypothetical protein